MQKYSKLKFLIIKSVNIKEIIKNKIKYNLFFKSDLIQFNCGPIAMNIKNGIKYINKSKLQFIEHFIMTKTHKNSKIIFCSQFTKIFNELIILLNKYKINFIELDNGNINDINQNIFNYN